MFWKASERREVLCFTTSIMGLNGPNDGNNDDCCKKRVEY
jgi:hypothetical protein